MSPPIAIKTTAKVKVRMIRLVEFFDVMLIELPPCMLRAAPDLGLLLKICSLKNESFMMYPTEGRSPSEAREPQWDEKNGVYDLGLSLGKCHMRCNGNVA